MKETDRTGQLFEAIVEAPDDDEPRLVYADLLQQQGDPRGEFIQVQCALAKDPTNRNARIVENKLLGAHGEAWRTDTAELAPEVEFRRGFIDRATIHLAHLRRIGELVRAAPLLRGLRVVPGLGLGEAMTAANMPLDGFAEPALARLTELELSLAGTGNRLAAALASAPLDRLRRLAIHASVWGEMAAYYPEPRDQLALTATGAALLASSPSLAGVTHLAIDQNRIAADGVRVIANGRWRLVELDVGENAIADLGDALGGPATAMLHTLRIAHTPLPAADLKWLVTELPALRDLDLERCDLGKDGAATLCKAIAVPLSRLRVERNSLGDAGMSLFAACPKLATLRELEAGHNRMGHKAAVAIASSPHFAALERLTLSEPRWKDDTKAVLAASPTLARARVYLAGKLISKDAKKKATVETPAPKRSRRSGSKHA